MKESVADLDVIRDDHVTGPAAAPITLVHVL